MTHLGAGGRSSELELPLLVRLGTLATGGPSLMPVIAGDTWTKWKTRKGQSLVDASAAVPQHNTAAWLALLLLQDGPGVKAR